MNQFHSMVSRRDFMKGLGFGAIGLGAAAAAAPVFHDLDELISSEGSAQKRPWWVKERELDDPTVELDWNMLKPHDCRLTTQADYVNGQYAGDDAWKQVKAEGSAFSKTLLGGKGNTVRDKALGSAAQANLAFESVTTDGHFAGPQKVATPEKLGLPKWTGTHEEASKMLRAAATFLGARTGFSELGAGGSKHRNLIYTYQRRGSGGASYMGSGWPPPLSVAPRQVQEDIDPGYIDGELIHIPNKELWKVACMVPMSKEAWRTAQPDYSVSQASAANISRYRLWSTVLPCLQEFLRGIGYMGYGGVSSGSQIVPSESSAVLSGLAEMGRHSEAIIDPEYGSNQGYWTLVTDLPLAPDHPIDAGIFRFCHTVAAHSL